MNGIRKGTVMRTAVLLIALVNTTLQLFGVDVLPFTENEVEMGVSAVLNVTAALAAWWWNNSFTEKAREADKQLHAK